MYSYFRLREKSNTILRSLHPFKHLLFLMKATLSQSNIMSPEEGKVCQTVILVP